MSLCRVSAHEDIFARKKKSCRLLRSCYVNSRRKENELNIVYISIFIDSEKNGCFLVFLIIYLCQNVVTIAAIPLINSSIASVPEISNFFFQS